MEKEKVGITVGKNENFPEWYSQVTVKSRFADYGPVHGTIAFTPYSYAVWEKIQEIFNEMIKKTGHRNAYFPMLIPESFLTKEAEHFKNFVPEVFWVTQEGKEKLNEKFAIRPTSETIVNHFFAKWVRSWRDLPILMNQWCNILRAEIKDTKPFIRTSEFLWQEGHTAHETKEEAAEEVMRILEFYRQVVEDYLAVPVLIGKKSEMEKFGGADYTTTMEAIMPDGKAIQMGTSHHLGQNFAKPFGIKFLGRDNKESYAWTTSWGISTRLIGAMIMTHGDDKGLVIPPKVAGIQIVIIPIFKQETKDEVLKFTNKVKKELDGKFSIMVDDEEGSTPGYKFNEWEMRGIPLRIEIGPKDIEKNQVTAVRRDTGQKISVPTKDLVKETEKLLDDIQKNLYKKAKEILNDNTHEAKSYDEFKKIIASKGGFVKANWCGKDSCELKIKEETTATCRVIPFDQKKKGKCIVCGTATDTVAYFAKAY